MSEPTFGEATRRWSSLAAQLLGWRPPEFWAATPHELAASLSDPAANNAISSPSRELIETLMERDAHE